MAQTRMGQLSDEVIQQIQQIDKPWMDSYLTGFPKLSTIAGTNVPSTMSITSGANAPVYGTEIFELVDNVLIVSINKLKGACHHAAWYHMSPHDQRQHATFYIRSHKTGRLVKMIYPDPGSPPVSWEETKSRPDYKFPLFFMVAPSPEQEDLMKKGLKIAVTE